MVSHQSGESLMSKGSQMPSAIKGVKSGDGQLPCVADVMEKRCCHKDVGVLQRHPMRQLPCDLGHRLSMLPASSKRTQQPAGVIFGPGAQLHALTVRQPKREPGCEDFLYRIKRAGLRAA